MINTLNVLQIVTVVIQVVTANTGEWTNWSDWSACSVSCGYGIVTRERRWRFDTGEFSNLRYTHSIECWTETPCPIDGGWSVWRGWNECSEMCGGGIKERYRECANPKPSDNGKLCEGGDRNQTECNIVPCPPLPQDFDLGQCDNSTFMCYSLEMCVQQYERCDYIVQCHDGSDEKNCHPPRYTNAASSRITVNTVVGLISALLMWVLLQLDKR